MDRHISGSTYFRTPLGYNWQSQGVNENVSFTPKTIKRETNPSVVSWSNLSGGAFPALNTKLFPEPVESIAILPSYMRMQYQNTLAVFTRNTISRIILSDDLSSMATAVQNEIEEYPSGGLFAKDSLTLGGGAVFWLSESGVIRWDRDGMANISYGVMDIPISDNYIGLWVGSRRQYILHNKATGISYVFHDGINKWTIFTGLEINSYCPINFGDDKQNKILLVTDDFFMEYPSEEVDENCQHRIHSKKFYLGNNRVIRYRARFDSLDEVSMSIRNDILSEDSMLYVNESPERYKWVMLPTTAWGESLQILLDNPRAIRSVEIDLKEGV